MTNGGSGGRINKACDGCRVRKVRCNGARPCSQCSHLDLPCHFAPPTGKRKPGVRGRLVAKVRQGANGSNGSSGGGEAADTRSSPEQRSPESMNPMAASGLAPPLVHDPWSFSGSPPTSLAALVNPLTEHPTILRPNDASNGRLPPPNADLDPSPYPAEFFLRLIPDFESVVYPFNPVLTPDEMRAAVTTMHDNPEDAALVYAFATVTINLTQTSWHLNGDVAAQMEDLIRRSLAAHRQVDIGGSVLHELPVTIRRIQTCLFLEISLMAFKRFDRSFAILREAIAMIQTLKVYQYTRDDARFDRREVARRQRLFWECYIHERFVNIMSGNPSILHPLSSGMPFPDVSIPSHVDLGFRRLIYLFRIMDGSFLAFWDAQRDRGRVTPELTAEWIERKQAELDRDEAEAAEDEERSRAAGGTGLTELQHADLFVTRLWLRTLVWQLALSRGLLRSVPAQNVHEGMSLHFPAQRLSAQLRNLVSRLGSVASIGTHGSGILQKLFEITSTVADVLALPPPTPSTGAAYNARDDAKNRMEDFIYLVDFLFRFERIPKDERDYMREKLLILQQLYTVVDFQGLASSPTAYHPPSV